jgi:hypothetical protein
VPISSTNTNSLPSSPQITERHTNLSHSSLSLAPVDLFSAVSKVSFNRSADRRLAHLNPASCEEKLAPLFVGSPRATLDVLLKQSHGASLQLRTGAWGLLGSKRTILIKPLKVAPDRRTVDPEPMGGLALGDALLYGLYYLGAQIYRIGFYLPMVSSAATSPQAAVKRPHMPRELKGAWKLALRL